MFGMLDRHIKFCFFFFRLTPDPIPANRNLLTMFGLYLNIKMVLKPKHVQDICGVLTLDAPALDGPFITR